MPLPDTPPPEDSNIYQQLSSSKIQELTQSNFDIVRNPVFLSFSNEDELRRLQLVGEVTGHSSSSGPFIGTLKCVVTDSITSTAKTSVYTPADGEIWQVIGMSSTATNATGTTSYYSQLVSGSIDVFMASTSSGSTSVALWSDADYKNPIYISSDVTLQVNINSTSNLDSYVIKTALVRVR